MVDVRQRAYGRVHVFSRDDKVRLYQLRRPDLYFTHELAHERMAAQPPRAHTKLHCSTSKMPSMELCLASRWTGTPIRLKAREVAGPMERIFAPRANLLI